MKAERLRIQELERELAAWKANPPFTESVNRDETERLRTALKGSRAALLEYIRGESGEPFIKPYVAVRNALEIIDTALDQPSPEQKRG